MDFVIMYAALATLSAFCILFIGKTGLRDWVIGHTPRVISKLFGCDFCLSFWTAAALSLAAALAVGPWYVIFMPVFLAPVIRMLI